MDIQTLRLVYFSPTGTTKKIVQSIAKGINKPSVKYHDITPPEQRKNQIIARENELLIVAV